MRGTLPPPSTSRSKEGLGHRGRLGLLSPQSLPIFLPRSGMKLHERLSVGKQFGIGWEEGRDPFPFPGWPPGSQHSSQAPEFPGPGLGKLRSYISSSGKSVCEKAPEGPSARSSAQAVE